MFYQRKPWWEKKQTNFPRGIDVNWCHRLKSNWNIGGSWVWFHLCFLNPRLSLSLIFLAHNLSHQYSFLRMAHRGPNSPSLPFWPWMGPKISADGRFPHGPMPSPIAAPTKKKGPATSAGNCAVVRAPRVDEVGQMGWVLVQNIHVYQSRTWHFHACSMVIWWIS